MVSIRPVSDAFLAAVTGSHLVAFRATALSSYQEGVSPSGTQIPVIGGDVTLDATADVRGTLDLTTDGTGWDTRPGRSLLQPYGTEVFIERGVILGGSTTWVSQGYFKIQTVEQAAAPDGTLEITASDRMQGIIDAQLPSPRSYAATDTVLDVFNDLVLEIYPAATIDFDYTASTDELGSPQVTDTDRHGFLADVVTTRGKVMYWDYRGHLVIKDPPDPTMPVLTVGAGKGGVLISADRTLSRDGVNNAIVVTSNGSGTSDAPLAVAYDNNPKSPTYFFGPYGQVPLTFSNPLVTTFASAQATAILLLQKAITLPLTANLTAVPNPALEPLDPLKVTYGRGSAPDTSMVIDTLTIPLNATDPWTATVHDPGPMKIKVE